MLNDGGWWEKKNKMCNKLSWSQTLQGGGVQPPEPRTSKTYNLISKIRWLTKHKVSPEVPWVNKVQIWLSFFVCLLFDVMCACFKWCVDRSIRLSPCYRTRLVSLLIVLLMMAWNDWGIITMMIKCYILNFCGSLHLFPLPTSTRTQIRFNYSHLFYLYIHTNVSC